LKERIRRFWKRKKVKYIVIHKKILRNCVSVKYSAFPFKKYIRKKKKPEPEIINVPIPKKYISFKDI